jgi:uncharacterized protein (TIGR02266 family)
VPLEREVVLEFEHFSSFIREYSANISLGGMFIKTGERRLPGTVFRFEIRLVDDAPLVAGLAKVLWVRHQAEGTERPAGMGVQFLQLEAEGGRLIERIVREHASRGGEPFDVERAAAAAVAGGGAGDAAAEDAPSALETNERSTVIELPPLDELLERSERRETPPALGTPPRGWKPGISSVRPQTRPQFLLAVAVVGLLVAVAVFFAVRRWGAPPVLESSEVEPPALPRAEQPAESAEPPPLLPRFTALEDLSWQRRGAAAEVVVRVDGSLEEGSWSESRMTDPPRHLLKLLGASRPYPTENIEVGFGGVRQLRTGYHVLPGGDEQHVVIDLVDPRVILDGVESDQTTLRLRFRRVGP